MVLVSQNRLAGISAAFSGTSNPLSCPPCLGKQNSLNTTGCPSIVPKPMSLNDYLPPSIVTKLSNVRSLFFRVRRARPKALKRHFLDDSTICDALHNAYNRLPRKLIEQCKLDEVVEAQCHVSARCVRRSCLAFISVPTSCHAVQALRVERRGRPTRLDAFLRFRVLVLSDAQGRSGLLGKMPNAMCGGPRTFNSQSITMRYVTSSQSPDLNFSSGTSLFIG